MTYSEAEINAPCQVEFVTCSCGAYYISGERCEACHPGPSVAFYVPDADLWKPWQPDALKRVQRHTLPQIQHGGPLLPWAS